MRAAEMLRHVPQNDRPKYIHPGIAFRSDLPPQFLELSLHRCHDGFLLAGRNFTSTARDLAHHIFANLSAAL